MKNIIFVFVLFYCSFMPFTESLECFLEKTTLAELPYWRNVCHKPLEWMQNSRAENCIKIIHGGYIERSCDSEFYCTRFHIRNRCVNGLLGDGSEICCCSTNRCNSSTKIKILITPILFLSFFTIFLKHII